MAPNTFLKAGSLSILCLILACDANSQTQPAPVAATTQSSGTAQQKQAMPNVVVPQVQDVLKVTGRSNLFCAGYIKYQKIPKSPEIVGAEAEPEQHTFADGDIVFLNAGSQQGITEGERFQIIRPRGDVKGVFREKKGFLGTYVQELGQLQVFKVRENTAIAQITSSCEMVLLGDLVLPIPDREAPALRAEVDLDRFANPTGKQTGRLMMAKDGREMVTKNDVVYIDLGSEDSINVGDYLTIYRPLGAGGVTTVDAEEIAVGRASGFQSDHYRGGGFSTNAQRAKDSTAFVNTNGRYRYRPITTREIKRHRPPMPRKVVGEMVIIDVQSRTATAILTTVAGEVHTGDWVEIQ
jgi:hypothetical protein